MMRIGVSIMTGDRQNVWNNGLVQNIYHFVTLLSSIPFVEAVYLINCGDRTGHPEGADEAAKRIPLLPPAEAFDAVDLAIEMGGAIDIELIRQFRFRGGKYILYLCGQPYASLVESTVFGREGFFLDPQRFEEIWLLAKDMIFAPMMRTVYRCPVEEVPYLWSPRFLEQTIQRADDGSPQFGYRRGSLDAGRAWPAIFEPNISPIKMGVIPFMICDAVERQSSGLIERVTYLNGDVLLKHHSYIHLVANSDLYRNRKTLISGRDYFAKVMGRGANIVVSHQINCPQNYVYMDALYGAYPLIHNSRIFRDVGYFYNESDINDGARAFLAAIESHDRNLGDYETRSKALIAGLAPTARSNIDHYARRLIALMGAADRRKSA